MMQVHVLPFGVLKEWLGASPATVGLPDGSSVADLLEQLRAERPTQLLRGIAVSVNAEFASASHLLLDGDEVGLLPPVSGGAPQPVDSVSGETRSESEPGSEVALTYGVIDKETIIAAVREDEDGALVIFDGVVRNNSRGRQTLYLDYEAYDQMAFQQMKELVRQALGQFDVRHVSLVHRLGRIEVGESSVLFVVASAHRAAAFDACRWLIDTLKKTVPIWKKEFFVDGAVWSPGEPFPDPLTLDSSRVPEAQNEV
jgi:molybdopterin synthase catalytic subunit